MSLFATFADVPAQVCNLFTLGYDLSSEDKEMTTKRTRFHSLVVIALDREVVHAKEKGGNAYLHVQRSWLPSCRSQIKLEMPISTLLLERDNLLLEAPRVVAMAVVEVVMAAVGLDEGTKVAADAHLVVGDVNLG